MLSESIQSELIGLNLSGYAFHTLTHTHTRFGPEPLARLIGDNDDDDDIRRRHSFLPGPPTFRRRPLPPWSFASRALSVVDLPRL